VDAQGEWLASLGDDATETVVFKAKVPMVRRPYDLFSLNAEAIEADFDLLTRGRSSAPLSSSNTLIGDRIFAEPGALVEASVLNSRSGAIYLAAGSEIMEGSLVRGALALGEGSQLKMGSKIYGATTIGPGSKVGGEVNNAVLWGNSNKGHDGFLGNAVLGEWCNLGADTNNSNLKNDYSEVKLWSYPSGRFEPTGLQFCGLVMGDHSKAGINTMFNTGTVVGVACNLFGAGFPRNFIPDFSWGGPQGMS
jgi:UDP-N-acetylglucosamine diphosphorylase/glucosamine-1-phosphate N-acetyltransferase